jgi:HNH endonuclease
MKGTMRERVFARLIIDQESGCLLWTGALTKGYGVTSESGQNRYVHRVMYEWFVGPIPDGTEIDHLCRVKHCAAPAHLEAVTHAENAQRGEVRLVNGTKTHCPHGHLYDEANTYLNKGKRSCRQCTYERNKARRLRLAAPKGGKK